MSVNSKLASLIDPQRPVTPPTMVWLALVTILADQLSKWWALLRLGDGSRIVLLPNFLEFRYQVNTGAAFSILEGHTFWLAVFSAVVSAGLFIWGLRLPRREWGMRIPFGLILGGAVGNLIDRARLGHVIDFILAHWYDHYWPTFNVADSAVCIGIGWLILSTFLASADASEAAHPPAAAPADAAENAQSR